MFLTIFVLTALVFYVWLLALLIGAYRAGAYGWCVVIFALFGVFAWLDCSLYTWLFT